MARILSSLINNNHLIEGVINRYSHECKRRELQDFKKTLFGPRLNDK